MKNNILIAALLFAAFPLLSNTLVVCPDCPVNTIAKGIALANPCDTVLVQSGTYYENNIEINKDLTLIGEGMPVVDGKEQGEIFTVENKYFYIEGFRIQNVGRSYVEDRAGIRIRKSTQFTIRNNEFDEAFFAIYLQNSSKGLIEGNHISAHSLEEANSGNAIHAWYCSYLEIANNVVKGNRDGIYLEFVDNSLIHNNLSQDNIRYGLHFMFSDDDSYYDNEFVDNGAGVAVMYSKNIVMQRNVFRDNWGAASYGLLLKDIFDSEIFHNRFNQNTVGIFMETSNRLKIQQNEFSENGWAVKMSGGNQTNILSKNNFLHNTFNLSVHSAGTDNVFSSNYWSDYAGYDLDKDGVGDVPHRPMKLFSYVVSSTPEAMVLLRSLFIDLLNFSEKVSPIFTPENVIDETPLMTPLPVFGKV
ncbi:MAG: nitrous oxide reductase [Saprospirales bacterium]|nr:nitrous oxide reductase [Saprospirales bacterium]